MKKSKTTILEIADQAGVSPATVSRVLNHRSLVKADTISKVEEAMRTLGYSSGSGNTSGIDNVPVIILNIPDTNTISIMKSSAVPNRQPKLMTAIL